MRGDEREGEQGKRQLKGDTEKGEDSNQAKADRSDNSGRTDTGQSLEVEEGNREETKEEDMVIMMSEDVRMRRNMDGITKVTEGMEGERVQFECLVVIIGL